MQLAGWAVRQTDYCLSLIDLLSMIVLISRRGRNIVFFLCSDCSAEPPTLQLYLFWGSNHGSGPTRGLGPEAPRSPDDESRFIFDEAVSQDERLGFTSALAALSSSYVTPPPFLSGSGFSLHFMVILEKDCN